MKLSKTWTVRTLMNLCAVFVMGIGFQAVAYQPTWGDSNSLRDRGRSFVIFAEGVGGTSRGDRAAACQNAEERADADLRMQCSRPNQQIADQIYDRCNCVKKAGSRDDYTCRIKAKAVCHNFPGYRDVITIRKEGSGGTSRGDTGAACARAEERAFDEARFECSRRRGSVLDSVYGSCRCTKKAGSKDDYTCRTTVSLNCELF
jgi:hypothetical protein